MAMPLGVGRCDQTAACGEDSFGAKRPVAANPKQASRNHQEMLRYRGGMSIAKP
jgi:hypothetical protein